MQGKYGPVVQYRSEKRDKHQESYSGRALENISARRLKFSWDAPCDASRIPVFLGQAIHFMSDRLGDPSLIEVEKFPAVILVRDLARTIP